MPRALLIAVALGALSHAQEPAKVTQPRLTHKVEPQYTTEARDKKIQGTVELGAVVGIDGVPSEFQVRRSLGYGLDEKAIQAVSKWRFQPGTKDGVAVPVIVTVQVNFRLLDDPKNANAGVAPSANGPQVIKRVAAKYTDEARKKNIQGRVGLRVTVGADGTTKEVQVLSPLDPGLDQKAIESVKQWQWEPAKQDGKPIDAAAMVDITFNLGSASDEFLDHAEKAREEYNKGVHYLNGDNVPQDLRLARAYFKQSAEQAFAPAQCALALMILHGEGGPQDDLEAFTMFKKAADQKYAKAQFYVGLMYTEGKGTWRDDTQALRWYRLAAAQNNAAAEAQIGWVLENGRGLDANLAEAAKWYQKAALHGSAKASLRLGQCYRDGIGVAKDPVEALVWTRLAISKDAPEAEVEAANLSRTLSKEDLERADKLVKGQQPKP